MQKPSKLIAILFTLTIVIGMAVPAVASGVDFSVSPVVPENQVENPTGYFDLLMQPGQVQDLTVTISNPTNKDAIMTVEAITASTNRNGIVNYTSNGKNDETLKYAFSDLAKVHESELVIPANSSKDAVITVTMPNEEYDGRILGSIRILKPADQNNEGGEDGESGGTSIANQYSYVFGVSLVVNDTVVEPDFAMDTVSAELVNYRAAVVNYIRNTQPVLIKNLEVSAEVYQQGVDQPIFKQSQQDVEMAPNSIFEYTLSDDEGYGLPSGMYTSKVKLIHNGKEWEFEKEFEIKAEAAQDMNENAINTEQFRPSQSPTDSSGSSLPVWAIVLIIVGGLLIIGVIIFIIIMMRIKRENKEFEIQQQVQDLNGAE